MRMGRMGAAPLAQPDRDREDERYRQGRKILFTYQTPNIATIAGAGVQATNIIQFDNDSNFMWVRSTVFADLAGASIEFDSFLLPLVNLLITDTGSGQAFMNAAIPVGMVAGSAQLPYVLPAPQFVASNTTYQFQWTNYSAGSTYLNLRLQLHGYKVYGNVSPPSGF